MTAAAPSLKSISLNAFAGLGDIPGDELPSLNFVDATLQGNATFSIPVNLAANSTDEAVTIPVPQLLVLCISDVTVGNTDTVKYALASGLAAGAKHVIAAGKCALIIWDPNTATPILYFTSGATDNLRLKVTGIGVLS